MKIVCISDTHSQNLLTKWNWPEGDILIHAGDMTSRGHRDHMQKIGREILQLHYRYNIVVGGNHDRSFWETDSKHYSPEVWRLLPGIIVLQDEAITIGGIKFYGTSWLTFERDIESAIPKWEAVSHNKLWSKIPSDTDVLITHLPPYGILDVNKRAMHLGSETLRQEVLGRIKPKLHVFGHVHINRGMRDDIGSTTFVNAALVDEEYKPAHQPIVIEVDEDSNHGRYGKKKIK